MLNISFHGKKTENPYVLCDKTVKFGWRWKQGLVILISKNKPKSAPYKTLFLRKTCLSEFIMEREPLCVGVLGLAWNKAINYGTVLNKVYNAIKPPTWPMTGL